MSRRLVTFGTYSDDGNEITPDDRRRLRELIEMVGSQRAAIIVQRPIEQIEAAANDSVPYRWTVRDPWELRTRLEDAVVRWQERLGR